MRISKDPNDEAYDDTAVKRRVWSRDQEVTDWLTADEFRRVVITMNGRVLNGACRIERIAEDSPVPDPVEVVEPPVNTGFVGLGLVYVPDKAKPTPVGAPVAAPAPEPTPEPTPELTLEPVPELIRVEPEHSWTPQIELPLEEVRPEVPDNEVDELQSSRLPDNEPQE